MICVDGPIRNDGKCPSKLTMDRSTKASIIIAIIAWYIISTHLVDRIFEDDMYARYSDTPIFGLIALNGMIAYIVGWIAKYTLPTILCIYVLYRFIHNVITDR